MTTNNHTQDFAEEVGASIEFDGLGLEAGLELINSQHNNTDRLRAFDAETASVEDIEDFIEASYATKSQEGGRASRSKRLRRQRDDASTSSISLGSFDSLDEALEFDNDQSKQQILIVGVNKSCKITFVAILVTFAIILAVRFTVF